MTKNNKLNFWASLTNFQRGFFIVFILASIFSFISPLFLGSKLDSIFSILGVVGLICSVTGVLTSIYQARGEIIVYAFLLTNTITYAYISFETALYGQVIQNIILLLPIQIAGLIGWKKSMANSTDNSISIKKFTPFQWGITILGLIIFWIIYYIFLKELPNIFMGIFNMKIVPDPSPALDSLTTVLTVMAMILTSKRFIEQWWFWIFCNIGAVLFIQSLLHTSHFTPSLFVSDLSGMFNWLQYGVGAIYGFYLWKKMYKEKNAIQK